MRESTSGTGDGRSSRKGTPHAHRRTRQLDILIDPAHFPSSFSSPPEVPLARVTVEDCLEKVTNRFALVILAAERARQVAGGAKPLVRCDNKPAVTSLREIAKGLVAFNEHVEGTVRQYLEELKRRGLADGQ